MIEEVRIENFKCFQELELTDLGRITLIGGRNNVGKTALLEAMFLFLDRTQPNMILRQYGWRGIEGVVSTPEGMWGPIFRDFDMDQQILIAVTTDKKSETATYKVNPRFPLQSLSPTKSVDGSKQREIRTDQEPVTTFALDIEYDDGGEAKQTSHLVVDAQGNVSLQIDYLVSTGHPGVFLPSKKHVSAGETSDRFSKLAKLGKEDEVVNFLQLIEPRLTALKSISEGARSVVHGQVEGLPQTLPVAFMGEGVSKLLDIIVAIANCNGGTVFVDEIENGIRYSAMPDIWREIGNAAIHYECQIIATTHSYECLEAAHQGLADVSDEFRYIRMDRKEGRITGKISTYKMLEAAIASNMEVR